MCGNAQPNPVIGRDGNPIPVTIPDYDPATNTVLNTTGGTHQYTWNAATGLPVAFCGTLAQTVISCTAPASAAEADPQRKAPPARPTLLPQAAPHSRHQPWSPLLSLSPGARLSSSRARSLLFGVIVRGALGIGGHDERRASLGHRPVAAD